MQDKYKQQSRLSFTYNFEYEHDTVFFSHFVPYTYSDLTAYLGQLLKKSVTEEGSEEKNNETPPTEESSP